ncbi:MAG: COG2426 family protein [Peptococcaceae bacterium]
MSFLSLQEVRIILLSALPLTELRLAIPLAIAWGIDPLKSYLLACIGNFLPLIPFLLILEPLHNFILKVPYLNKIMQRLLLKTRGKGRQVEKYGALGLIFFVAVPLPGTGIYSGAVLAFLFGIRFWFALPALTLGMLLAGLAVTLASAGTKELAGYIYDFEYVVMGIIVAGIIYYLLRRRHKNWY